ncbi:MAG: 50S ribosomal protein L6 [Candidatus Hodarchaeota archaeon]
MEKAAHSEKTIPIPEGVQIQIEGRRVTVTGSRGSLTRDFSHSPIHIEKVDETVKTYVHSPRKKVAAMVNTIAAHIENMILGVTQGFTYIMKIVFAHFPITVRVDQDKKQIRIENFIGERAPRYVGIYGDVNVSVEGDDVVIRGNNIEEVAQTAANIQARTKIKDKDPRVFMDGIFIYRKLVGDDVIWKIL